MGPEAIGVAEPAESVAAGDPWAGEYDWAG